MVHIKCAQSGLRPALAVLVTTVRAIKHHSGLSAAAAAGAGSEAVHAGCGNLAHHIAILRHFGLPVVVAVNRFPADTDAECRVVLDEAAREGAAAAVTVDVFAHGGEGGLELARAVVECSGQVPTLHPCYEPDDSLTDKIAAVARKVYGAGDVELSRLARRKLELLTAGGLGGLPVCMAKTPLSLSHDPTLLGTPRGFTLPVTDLRPAAGAGYVTALTGDIYTMPGLPARPAACDLELDLEVGREQAQARGAY
jgi:formyltetrahydrofolate synthetase